MRILSPQQLSDEKGVNFSNPHRWELERTGRFPKRVRLGDRRYGYLESEIDNFIAQRAALREAS
jgi:prophage regulatory protein